MTFIDEFLADRRPNTRRAYQNDLEAFRAFMNATTAEDAVRGLMRGGYSHTMHQFGMYMEHLLRAGKARATIARYIAAVRSTLLLAEKRGLITWTPPPRPPFPPAYQNTASGDLAKLDFALEQLSKKTSTIAVRDYALVLLIGRMALRRSEVSALEFDDISLERGEISIRRFDGLPPDIVKMTAEVLAGLKRWLDLRGDHSGGLFLAARGTRSNSITDRTIGRVIARYNLGSPRVLRHLAITSFLERTGGDLAGAMEFGRIRRSSTVGTYERNRQERLL